VRLPKSKPKLSKKIETEMNIMTAENNIRFADEAHRAFYIKHSQKLKPDVYLRSLIYTIGICHDTRRNFDSIYDAKKRVIIKNAICQPWQTGTSLKVTRLAFQLFTDSTPTAFMDEQDDIDECKRYSVSDIFCCSFAPYFFEAISLRYREYMTLPFRIMTEGYI
jgi:uncharacterized protein YcaQ